MQQIGATADGSYKFEKGKKGVLVGILDTGVDGSHPDIAPNFNAQLSRNFTVDIPVDANGAAIDGPCAAEPDQSCNDPSNVDENGHGTHVASTIASPINGIGIAGVAPKATIVNLRAGQDSGYFFLQPSVDALTYAGHVGIDVVNMSYYVDPWLFNCKANPADSPANQAEQRTIIEAMQRALDFAHRHGVTLVAAAGNGATDYTKVITDASSPDFADVPGEAPYARTIDPVDCISMPSEGGHVISVSATGISTRKSYYSDYGNGYVDIAAPGGDVYDTPGNTRDITKAVLAAYPESLARSTPGVLDPEWRPARGERREELQHRRHVRVLPVLAGHVDGVTARGRCGGVDRQQVRIPRPAQRWADVVAGSHRVDPACDGDGHPVSGAAGVHIHAASCRAVPRSRRPTSARVNPGPTASTATASSTPAGRSATSAGLRDSFREFSRDVYLGGLWTITYTTRGDTP